MPALDRIAPTGGYTFAAKQEHRDEVWRTFASHCNPATALVGLMPSWERGTRNPCPEIETALALGFQVENLYAIDRNAEICRKIKARYPRINILPASLVDACRVLAFRQVKLNALNADLCCSAEQARKDFSGIFERGGWCFEPGALVAVTSARRDWAKCDSAYAQAGLGLYRYLLDKIPEIKNLFYRSITTFDCVRLWTVYEVMNTIANFRYIRGGIYQSSGNNKKTTMMWNIFQQA